jgi:CHAT domain-containing protein
MNRLAAAILLAAALAAAAPASAADLPKSTAEDEATGRNDKLPAATRDAAWKRVRDVIPGDAYLRERQAIDLELADIEVARGRYGEAIALDEAVEKAAAAAGDHVLHARALDRQAYARRELGDFPGAKDAAERSQVAAGRIGDPFIREYARARSLNLVGSIDARIAEEARWRYDERTVSLFLEAIASLRQAATIAEQLVPQENGRRPGFVDSLEVPAKTRVAWTRSTMSTAQAMLADLLVESERSEYLAEAEISARAAVDITAPRSGPRASALHFLARVQARRGQFGAAAASLDEAESIWTSMPKGTPFNIAYAYTVRAGEVFGRQPGKESQSLEYYRKARAVFAQTGRCSEVAAMDFLSGRSLERLGRKDEAKQAYVASIALYEALRATLSGSQRLEFFSVRMRPYEALIRLLFESWSTTRNPKDAEEAFAYSERSRARSLLDTMEAARRASQPAVHKSAPPTEGCDIASLPAPDEKARAQSGLAAAQLLTAADVQAKVLAPGEALIEYFIGEDTSFAFVVRKDALDVVQLDVGKRDVVRRINRLMSPIEAVAAKGSFQPLAEYDLAESRRLYAALVEPLWPLVAQASGLIIVPHRTLFYLPFEALVADANGANLRQRNPGNFRQVRYLLDRAPPMRYALSASLLYVISGEKVVAGGTPGKMLAILNPPSQDRRLPPLTEFGDMWPSLKQHFGGIVDGRGKLGTKELFFSEGGSSDLVVLGVHGIFQDDAPLQSRLVLSGGELTAQEILQRQEKGERIPARLVTLAACRLGKGQLREGEGVVGLTRALQLAGSRQIVAALWSVDVRPTAQLVVAFHQAMAKSGATVRDDAALATAKKSVRNSTGDLAGVPYAHPFFWAGLVMH